MKSIMPIPAGEEIFNDYGPLPRSDLLRRYGYITQNYAQYDVVEIPRGLLLQACQSVTQLSESDAADRLEYLDEQGILEDGYDISRPATNQPDLSDMLAPEMLILLATLLMPQPDFAALKRKDKLPKPKLLPPFSTLLTAVLNARIAQYPTSLAEDRAARQQLSGRAAMAVDVRIGEKEILQAALQDLVVYPGNSCASAGTADVEGGSGPSAAKKRRVG